MDDRREGWFWLILLLVVVLTALYVQRHNLVDRYASYKQGVEQVREAEQQCTALKAAIDASRQRVEHLGNDPLEIEAAIRRGKDLVRSGETVFRIQVLPGDTLEKP